MFNWKDQTSEYVTLYFVTLLKAYQEQQEMISFYVLMNGHLPHYDPPVTNSLIGVSTNTLSYQDLITSWVKVLDSPTIDPYFPDNEIKL